MKTKAQHTILTQCTKIAISGNFVVSISVFQKKTLNQ